MEGGAREGQAFLDETEPSWAEETGYSVHLAWHRALFHLDANKPALALAAYDREIAKGPEFDMDSLADASALLWRLGLRDVQVGGRWRSLADHWALQPLAGARPFYLMHAIMAFASAGSDAAASWALEALPRARVCSVTGASGGRSRRAALPGVAGVRRHSP
jgi:hypothetical protein